MMYYVYILKSSKSGIYITDTQPLKQIRRTQRKISVYKGHMPWILEFFSIAEQKAKDFELYLKSGSGKAFVYKRLISDRSFSVGHFINNS